IIYSYRKVAVFGLPGQGGNLVPTSNLVGNQHVVDARLAHHDAFPYGRRTNTNRPRVDLHSCQFRALLTFDVRPEPRLQRRKAVGHEPDIPPDTIEIHDQGRGDKFSAKPATSRT